MKALNNFFFGDTAPDVLGFFRLALGCYLFISFLLFAPTAFQFFGGDAPLPFEDVRQYEGGTAFTVFSFAQTPTVVLACYLLTLLFLAAFAAGFLTPWSTLLSYLAFLSWRNGAVFIWNGGDDVQTTLLFLMTVAGFAGHTNRVLALDAVRSRKRIITIPAWTLRLIQIQFCLIYFFNALQKWMQPLWRSGQAVHAAVQDLSWSNIDLSVLSHVPLLIALLTYGVLLFLTLFPALIWYEETRKIMVTLSAIFHIVTRMFFNVFAFPVMVVALIVFLKPGEVERVVALVARCALNTRTSCAHN